MHSSLEFPAGFLDRSFGEVWTLIKQVEACVLASNLSLIYWPFQGGALVVVRQLVGSRRFCRRFYNVLEKSCQPGSLRVLCFEPFLDFYISFPFLSRVGYEIWLYQFPPEHLPFTFILLCRRISTLSITLVTFPLQLFLFCCCCFWFFGGFFLLLFCFVFLSFCLFFVVFFFLFLFFVFCCCFLCFSISAYIYWTIFFEIVVLYLSRDMTKPTKWVCAQRRLRSAWASTQSDQLLRCALSE